MTPSNGEHDRALVAFERAVDALCLSREQIARALDVDAATLDELVSGARPVPPVLLLALVDLVKTHESHLGAAAAALYEAAMLRLTLSGDRAPAARATAPPPSPPPKPPHPAQGRTT